MAAAVITFSALLAASSTFPLLSAGAFSFINAVALLLAAAAVAFALADHDHDFDFVTTPHAQVAQRYSIVSQVPPFPEHAYLAWGAADALRGEFSCRANSGDIFINVPGGEMGGVYRAFVAEVDDVGVVVAGAGLAFAVKGGVADSGMGAGAAAAGVRGDAEGLS